LFYRSGGTELFCTNLGSGPDVILIHPTPVHHGFWLPIAEQLSDRFRVTLPDLRGHGQSPADASVISMSLLAQDLDAMMEAAQIKNAVLIGCSIGCYTLYELWRRRSEHIQALGFCCGKPQPDTPANQAKRRETIERVKFGGADEFFDEMVQTLVGATCRRKMPDRVREIRAMMGATKPEAVIAVQKGLAERPDSVPTIPRISVPVLALAGGEDSSSAPDEMRIIPQLLPDCDYHLLPDAGHYAPFEQPDVVAGILRNFLETVHFNHI
jgi:pimeloyl-ACP methyl ester carboxylesterase